MNDAENKNKQRGKCLGKEPEMAYKKPQIIAKSDAKQTFVGGCPTKSAPCNPDICSGSHAQCLIGRLK